MADARTNEEARRAPTPAGLSDEKASRMLVALRGGRTLRSFAVRTARFEAYCQAHPEYAREALPLLAANLKAADLRKGEPRRAKTHCVNGHLLAENARFAISKGSNTRQCRACERTKMQRGGVMDVGILEKVKTQLAAGSSVDSLVRPGKKGYLVRYSTLARHRHENPEFDRFVSESIKANRGRNQKLRRQREHSAAVRDQNNDYFKIRAMLPANFPDKDDIVGAIFEDLLNGNLQRAHVAARVKDYVTAHNRMFPTKFAKFGDGKLLSLDERLFDGGATTLGDTISRGFWD